MTKYDIVYKKEKYLRGLQPNDLTNEILKYKSNGKVLDIGCGEGQDSVFLAKNGFELFGIDNSQEAIKNLNKLASKNNVSISSKISNFEDFNFEKKYDIVLAEASLHFLPLKDRSILIQKIKEHTTKNGINVIGVFDTRTSKSEKDELKKWGIYFFSKNELLKHYKDWKILFYKQFIEYRKK